MSAVKDAVLALFEPSEEVLEPSLPVAPAIEIDVIVCPHCDCPDCEVWSTTEARMADCPECGALFSPNVVESRVQAAVTQIFERRTRLRRQLSASAEQGRVKAEIFRLVPKL